MDPRMTELIQKEIKVVLNEYKNLTDIPTDVKKKMREVMSIKIASKALQLAEWAIASDGDSIDNFFFDLIETVKKKYDKYIDPEKMTEAEKAAVAKFELLSKRNIKITDYVAYYLSAENNEWVIYKKLYADGKHLAYYVSRDGKIVAKSKQFGIEKKQSLRELLSLMKSVWQY